MRRAARLASRAGGALLAGCVGRGVGAGSGGRRLRWLAAATDAASEAFTRRVLSLPASSRRLARAGARVEEIDALPPAEAARRGAERAAAATLLEAARQRDSAAADHASLRELADDAAAAGEPSLAAEARRETACADEALRAAERELARELTAGGAEGDGAHGGGGEPLGAILDARAGVGGVEAAHFLGQLRTSWRLYATRRGWAWTTLRESFTEQGDPSELLASVKGAGAFGALRHEAGIHRVQRVPMAQRSSANAKKMQTSAVLCAVLPEAGGGAGGRDGESLVDPADVRIETKRASGAGGQHVNVTDSAVRLTHVPTGISVSVQAERSQLRNKERAMRVLEARLRAKRDAAVAADRRDTIDEQSGGNFLFGGDRRVRTYHFPQSRLTDHRVPGGGDVDLNAFLENGSGLEQLHEELTMAEALAKLEAEEEGGGGGGARRR